MLKQNQTIKIEYSSSDYGIFRNQEVSSIDNDADGYAFGYWKGRLVGSFSIENGTWFNV